MKKSKTDIFDGNPKFTIDQRKWPAIIENAFLSVNNSALKGTTADDIVNIYLTIMFYENTGILDTQSSHLLNLHKKDVASLYKTLKNYFSKQSAEKLLKDFSTLKEHNDIYSCKVYFAALVYSNCFKFLSNSFIESLIENEYISLIFLLNPFNISLVKHFETTIIDIVLAHENSFIYWIEVYDYGGTRNYYLPPLNQQQINICILNYIKSSQCNLNDLRTLKAHRDSKHTYSISIENRIRIDKSIKEKEEELTTNGISIDGETQFYFAKKQKKPILCNRTKSLIEYSLSVEYFSKHLSNDDIIKILKVIPYLRLVDDKGRFIDCKPEEYNIIDFCFKMGGKQFMPLSRRSEFMENIYLFFAYYNFLQKKGIFIESIIEYLYKQAFAGTSHIDNVSLSFNRLNRSDEESCVLALYYLEKLLKQYQLFVLSHDNSENDTLGIETKENRYCDIKSTKKIKYYEPSDDFKSVLGSLFSPIDTIFQIHYKNSFHTDCLADAINLGLVKKDDIKDFVDLDKCIVGNILVLDSGSECVSFANSDIYFLLKEFYEYGYIPANHITRKQKQIIENELINKLKWIQTQSTLFFTTESNYLSFLLNDEKLYSDSLELRNKFFHGDTIEFTDDDFSYYYMIILRIIIMVLFKIDDDINK